MAEAGTWNQTCRQGGWSSCRRWEAVRSGRQNTGAKGYGDTSELLVQPGAWNQKAAMKQWKPTQCGTTAWYHGMQKQEVPQHSGRQPRRASSESMEPQSACGAGLDPGAQKGEGCKSKAESCVPRGHGLTWQIPKTGPQSLVVSKSPAQKLECEEDPESKEQETRLVLQIWQKPKVD